MIWMLLACKSADLDHFELGARLVAPAIDGERAVITRSSLEIQGLRIHPCSDKGSGWIRGFPATDRPRHLTVPTAVPAIFDPRARGVELPAGRWCSLDVLVAGDLSVELTVGEAQVVLDLDLGDLLFEDTGAFGQVRGAGKDRRPPPDLMLGIGDRAWLASIADDLAPGETFKVTSGTDAHDALVADLRDHIGLYVTDDADGDLTAPDFAAGAFAYATP